MQFLTIQKSVSLKETITVDFDKSNVTINIPVLKKMGLTPNDTKKVLFAYDSWGLNFAPDSEGRVVFILSDTDGVPMSPKGKLHRGREIAEAFMGHFDLTSKQFELRVDATVIPGEDGAEDVAAWAISVDTVAETVAPEAEDVVESMQSEELGEPVVAEKKSSKKSTAKA